MGEMKVLRGRKIRTECTLNCERQNNKHLYLIMDTEPQKEKKNANGTLDTS